MSPSTYSWNTQNIAQQHSRRIATPPLVSLRNGIWGSSAKIPYWWRVTSLILILLWLVVPWGQLATTNQKRYLDLGSFTSSVWNFFVCSSEVILARNQWLRHEIWTVFSGQQSTFVQNVLPFKEATGHLTCTVFVTDSRCNIWFQINRERLQQPTLQLVAVVLRFTA